MEIAALREALKQVGQEQVLRFYDQLSPAGRQKLVAQLQALDLKLIAKLADTYVRQAPPVSIPADISPISTRRVSTRSRRTTWITAPPVP